MLLVYISAILTTILWIIALFGIKDATAVAIAAEAGNMVDLD
ncbi:MAG: hypothetical protein RR712_00555 [Terrisporobacter sp.]